MWYVCLHFFNSSLTLYSIFIYSQEVLALTVLVNLVSERNQTPQITPRYRKAIGIYYPPLQTIQVVLDHRVQIQTVIQIVVILEAQVVAPLLLLQLSVMMNLSASLRRYFSSRILLPPRLSKLSHRSIICLGFRRIKTKSTRTSHTSGFKTRL